MRLNPKLIGLVVATMCSMTLLFSQSKNEREERIDVSELPEIVQEFIPNIPKKAKRLRFYKETDNDKQSYEIKFKYHKKRYSVEFSKDGELEDIEVLIKLEKLQGDVRARIQNHFESQYQKLKIIKLQKQFVYTKTSSQDEFLIQVMEKGKADTVNYEIIVEVRKDKKHYIREYTFNEGGKFVTYRDVVLSPYSHVLYQD